MNAITSKIRLPQEERAARTRHVLVEAAARLLAEGGYGAATTAAIAGRARVTTGALHHHFGTKEGLFFAVLDATNHRILGQVEQLRTATDAADIARCSIDRLWKAYGDPRYWAVWEVILGLRHDPVVRQRLLAHRVSSIDRVFAVWAAALAIPPAARPPLKDAFAFVLHAIRGLLLERMLKPDSRLLRRQLDVLAVAFEADIRAVLTRTAARARKPRSKDQEDPTA